MLASINPLGERGRHQRYPITLAAYFTASIVAAAMLGAVLGAAGRVVRPAAAPAGWTVALLAAAAVVGLAADAGVRGWRVPGLRRQVNEDWLATYRGWVYGAGFGAQLGLAFTTIVTASATWIAFGCAFVSGSATGGLVVGATFGLARAVPLLLVSRVRDASGLHQVFRMLDRARPNVARVTVASQAAAALLFGIATVARLT